MKSKAVVIGCGLVGSVIARSLAENNRMEVEIFERRNHIGGNLYDYVDEHGIRVHQYGPHIFHTNDKEIYDYICRFASWNPFKLVCGAEIDGVCVPTAFNFKSIDLFYSPEKAAEIKTHIRESFGNRNSATVLELLESSDPVIRQYAQFLYEKDYAPYTAKQWGISPTEIDSSVLKRVPIRFSYEEAYFTDRFQVMPKDGYTGFIKNVLNHEKIHVNLSEDGRSHLKTDINGALHFDGKVVDFPVIYTGPIDELFSCMFGKLPYRSLRFEWRYENIDSLQSMPIVAYPSASGFTRITEYKKLPPQDVSGTSYAVEYPIPYEPGKKMEPYYPILTENSQKLFQKYSKLAKSVKHLYCCGRLAEFKYFDMDQAIRSALTIAKTIN